MYQKMYCLLFNAVTTAIEEIRKRNYGNAESILIQAQQESEEVYLSCAGKTEDSRSAIMQDGCL
ncbi:MAG: hypothetical protein IJJ99_02840 [Oscillospiraceae bacterium]|nr:hypothetical protein [Oscillospiraceae bacterium]